MIPFGQILQRLRNEKRWSQSKLAEKLGLSASQVANYEMGRRLPSLQILIDMARILGVSTDYLAERLFFRCIWIITESSCVNRTDH